MSRVLKLEINYWGNNMKKTCTLCEETKLIEHFGKHKQMKDGHLNQCKVCRKEYTKAYQTKNKEKSKSTSKQQKFLEKTIQTHT